MIALKATQAQYDMLNGFTDGQDRLEFAKDGLGNWVVGYMVLYTPAFDPIIEQLELLEEIAFVPVPEES